MCYVICSRVTTCIAYTCVFNKCAKYSVCVCVCVCVCVSVREGGRQTCKDIIMAWYNYLQSS